MELILKMSGMGIGKSVDRAEKRLDKQAIIREYLS
jgi:hypothetical protein